MASTSSLPLIVLIHGSWHQPTCFSKIQTLLSSRGYTVVTPTLPTNSAPSSQPNPQATHLTDITALHTQLLPYLDQGKEAILVGHSYGAIPAMGCIAGNSVEERAALGKKGGFTGIVFLSGFAFPVRGMKLLSSMDVNWIEIKGEWAIANSNAREALYNGLPGAEIDEMMASLVPMSALSAMTPVELCAGDVKIPKTYVMTLLDKGLPLAVQEAFVEGTPDMKVVRLETGHSCFLVAPEKVVEIIVEAAGGGGGAE